MTARERASELAYDMVDDWYTKHDDVKASIKERRELVALIAAALADERRRVWEEAAKLICPYCNDPEWVTSDPEGDHLSPYTGNVFVCKSRKILAKAHAGQEG